MSEKKDKLLLVLNQMLDAPIIGLWGEMDGSAGYIVRQDGAFLGIGDYSEEVGGDINDLDVQTICKIIAECVDISKFDFEECEMVLSLNEVKWICELKENKGLFLNGRQYEIKDNLVGAIYESSGMKKSDFKSKLNLKTIVHYIDKEGDVKSAEPGSYPSHVWTQGDRISLFIQDDVSISVESKHTDYMRPQKALNTNCKRM